MQRGYTENYLRGLSMADLREIGYSLGVSGKSKDVLINKILGVGSVFNMTESLNIIEDTYYKGNYNASLNETEKLKAHLEYLVTPPSKRITTPKAKAKAKTTKPKTTTITKVTPPYTAKIATPPAQVQYAQQVLPTPPAQVQYAQYTPPAAQPITQPLEEPTVLKYTLFDVREMVLDKIEGKTTASWDDIIDTLKEVIENESWDEHKYEDANVITESMLRYTKDYDNIVNILNLLINADLIDTSGVIHNFLYQPEKNILGLLDEYGVSLEESDVEKAINTAPDNLLEYLLINMYNMEHVIKEHTDVALYDYLMPELIEIIERYKRGGR
jgi:hypothetical protein